MAPEVRDGSFSRGLGKASDAVQFRAHAARLFERSSIILAREYMYGGWETPALADVPPDVVETAGRAAGFMGDGVYVVDLKETDKADFVIEVNDNPRIDDGVSDRIYGDALCGRLIDDFVRRIQELRQGQAVDPSPAMPSSL